MARIGIYIGRHLCTAPRAIKEADALASAGYDVTVSGLWFDATLIARDQQLLEQRRWQFAPYSDCSPSTVLGRLRWRLVRLQSRIARNRFAKTRRITPDLLGYGATAMLRHARHARHDLSIFHSEAGLWVGGALMRENRRVGADLEDWYSQDLPVEHRHHRPVDALAALERSALKFGPYVITTSHALANALAEAYGGPKPAVIYNTFPSTDSPVAEADSEVPAREVALHWFSQTLGPDRGLETLLVALKSLPPRWRLALRGDDPSGFAQSLLRRHPASLSERIRVDATVPNADLPRRISEHDVGLALDISSIPSRDLTITNKIFQYMNAGLAIVASDTAGNREVFELAGDIGETFRSGDSQSLAAALACLCSNPDRLDAAKQQARHAATTVFAHERQIPIYAELVARALQPS